MMDAKTMVKDITIEYLESTKAGGLLQNARAAMEKAQDVAYAYVSDDSPEQLKTMRIGTALAFAVINKIAGGKSIKQFTKKDWEEIASNVADFAILTDGRQWSVIVFTAYADYVDISVNVIEKKYKYIQKQRNKSSEKEEQPEPNKGDSEEKNDTFLEKCEAIRSLATQVRKLEKELINDKITEVDYTEKCLWLLLEAMIKLLAAYSSFAVGEEASEFIQSVAMLAFEYGRYTLYKKEQEILELYIQHQKQVDAELQEKLDVFNALLRDREKEFEALINDAFVPDVMKRFRVSVELARSVGVNEEEILKTTEQVDEFFA